ncbi:MAG: hypothetical protein Q9216_003713 [Gyalolechia sp. 2 TL-2023]
MTSSTDFWFAPDAEFYAAVEDNVVVGEATRMTRPVHEDETLYDDDFDDDDNVHGDEEELPLKLSDILTDDYHYRDGLGFHTDGQLLYADVDTDDMSKLDINKRVAKEGCLEEESDKSKQAKDKLIDHLASLPWQSGCFWDEDTDEVDDEVEFDEAKVKEKRRKLKEKYDKLRSKVKDAKKYEEDRERITLNFEEEYGLLSCDKVDYILGLEDEGDRKEVLLVCSGQSKRKLQRPVVLLIDTIENPSANKPGTREGWAIVYSFDNNHLTIKPFIADKTHHPLAQKWDSGIPEDGICLTGHPATVVSQILSLEAQIKSEEQEGDIKNYASRILVYYSVARWLIYHWKALSGMKADGGTLLTDEDLEKVSDAKYFLLRTSAKIELPRQKRQPEAKKTIIRGFQHLQAHLEDYESSIRKEAVKAKKAGNEAAAEDAAKLYGKLTEMLQTFNVNAEKDV